MNTYLIYFSATGTTKQVLNTMFVENFTNLVITEYDLTDIQFTGISLEFSEEDCVIFGIPVYSGRVPKAALNRFCNIKGKNTKAILVATYGNRDYDDALLELSNEVRSRGFRTVAAVAAVTEHSVVNQIAAGRPNDDDNLALRKFAIEIMEKDFSKDGEVKIKGNRPYRKYQSIPLKPRGNSRCVECRKCVKMCPVGAISPETPKKTNKKICISCMRCVKYCPRKARGLSGVEQYISYKFIAGKCKDIKVNEIFI